MSPQAGLSGMSPSSPQLKEVEVASAPSNPSSPMAHVSVESPVQHMPQLLENLNVSASSTSSYNFSLPSSTSHSISIPTNPPKNSKRRSEAQLLLYDSPHERVASLERSWHSRATSDRYQGGTSANCD